jgi:hypothetical protein
MWDREPASAQTMSSCQLSEPIEWQQVAHRRYIGSTTTLMRKRSKSRAMNITPLRTKADHKAALKTIESLMGAKANTPEGDRLEVLVTLVEAYEAANIGFAA